MIKKMNLGKIYLLANCLVAFIISNAQQPPLTQKLLLHINKPICNVGDSIGFKCYVINNANHIGDDHNVYVMLTNKTGEIISKDRYPIINTTAFGKIIIPNNLQAGEYFIQTFTPYSINNKKIKQDKIIVRNINQATTANCSIFNNGKLISNLTNSLYIKTVNENKLPVSTSILITDAQNNEIYKTKTDENGVAKINFTPQRNQSYFLQLPSYKQTKPLPSADSTGINMQVSFEKTILNFLITKNYKIASVDDNFTLLAYQNNEIVYKTNLSFENYASISSGVNVANLPTGVISLTLENKNKEVVATNTIYLKNSKNFDEVAYKSSNLINNQKSVIDVKFPQNLTRFISASIEPLTGEKNKAISNFDFFFPLQQVDDQIIDLYEISSTPAQASTQNYTILQPLFALNKTNELTNIHKINDDHGITISGKVYENKNENVLSNGFLNFEYETQDSIYKYTTKVKNDGSFTLDSIFYNGLQKIDYTYLNANKKEIKCRVKLSSFTNENRIDSLLTNNFGYKLNKQELIPALLIEERKTTLPQVDSIASKKNKAIKNDANNAYSTGIYTSGNSELIDNIKFPPKDGAMNGGNFVRNNISNIAFQGGNIVNTKNFSLANSTYWPIGVVIDEIPASLTDLNLLTANDIGVIKFFEPGHVAVSSANSGGTLAIYTKNRVLNSMENKPASTSAKVEQNEQSFEYIGFSKNNLSLAKNKTKENEAIGFGWQPSILLLKEQNSFSFETPKLYPGKEYMLIIKGYNEMGKLINIEQIITGQ